jgi:hypothetical protein
MPVQTDCTSIKPKPHLDEPASLAPGSSILVGSFGWGTVPGAVRSTVSSHLLVASSRQAISTKAACHAGML